MFNQWCLQFGQYFNNGASNELKEVGPHIEASLMEAAQHYMNKYGMDPFVQRGNFQNYWDLVRFSLTNKGMPSHLFDELTGLVRSFNEGISWG